jgi:hypothetical protein
MSTNTKMLTIAMITVLIATGSIAAITTLQVANAASGGNEHACANSRDNTFVGCAATNTNPSNECCTNPSFSHNCVAEAAHYKVAPSCGP